MFVYIFTSMFLYLEYYMKKAVFNCNIFYLIVGTEYVSIRYYVIHNTYRNTPMYCNMLSCSSTRTTKLGQVRIIDPHVCIPFVNVLDNVANGTRCTTYPVTTKSNWIGNIFI